MTPGLILGQHGVVESSWGGSQADSTKHTEVAPDPESTLHTALAEVRLVQCGSSPALAAWTAGRHPARGLITEQCLFQAPAQCRNATLPCKNRFKFYYVTSSKSDTEHIFSCVMQVHLNIYIFFNFLDCLDIMETHEMSESARVQEHWEITDLSHKCLQLPGPLKTNTALCWEPGPAGSVFICRLSFHPSHKLWNSYGLKAEETETQTSWVPCPKIRIWTLLFWLSQKCLDNVIVSPT